MQRALLNGFGFRVMEGTYTRGLQRTTRVRNLPIASYLLPLQHHQFFAGQQNGQTVKNGQVVITRVYW